MNFNISPDWLQRTWTTHSWPVSNYQHQNGIAPSLQLRKHAAGAHDDQIATNPARTNNNQDGVQNIYQCQQVNIWLTRIITHDNWSILIELLNENSNRNRNRYFFECQILIIIAPKNIPGTSGAWTYSNQ